MADRETHVQIVGAGLKQQNRKNLKMDQLLDLLRGAGQHLVEIQRRIDFVADFGENCQSLRRDFRHRIGKLRFHLFRCAPLPPAAQRGASAMATLYQADCGRFRLSARR